MLSKTSKQTLLRIYRYGRSRPINSSLCAPTCSLREFHAIMATSVDGIPSNYSIGNSSSLRTKRTIEHADYQQLSCITRTFATNESEKQKDKQMDDDDSNSKKDYASTSTKSKESASGSESLRDTINRIKGDSDSNEGSSAADEGTRKATKMWDEFFESLNDTWTDLLNSGNRKGINKQIRKPMATEEGEQEYTGPVDIMVIDPSEHLTAWERMQKRLTDAPIISDILSRSEEIYEKTGAKKAKEKMDDVVEDAKEVWETSQNPWIYRVSSVYDTLTAETAESNAVRELRVLDPEFTLDDWRRDVASTVLPQIMEWFLQGKINQLKPWLGEGVFKRIAAEITARKQEGVQIDTHVLGVMNSEILACELDENDKSAAPIIVLHFMCQQINCVRNKKGEIVEGSEDDIRANSYVTAFQREFDEEKGELNWKIVDFRFNGAIAYI